MTEHDEGESDRSPQTIVNRKGWIDIFPLPPFLLIRDVVKRRSSSQPERTL